jgi:cyclase
MTRIITKLDVKPPYVVKPIHFEGLIKIRLPESLAKNYYEKGADELIYIDIVSSLYRGK